MAHKFAALVFCEELNPSTIVPTYGAGRAGPDEIRATKISSRLNKGNKDLTGQVGQVGQADLKIFNPDEIGFAPEK